VSLSKKMGDTHEAHLSEILGGAVTRGSGNQWKAQMDGRHNRMKRRFAFAWDGKSTLKASISVSLKMWRKAREQSGGERPLLALRFYNTEKLDDVLDDLVVLDLNDFAELLEVAESVKRQPTQIVVIQIPGSLSVRAQYQSLSPDYRFIMFRDGEVSWPREVVIDRQEDVFSNYYWAMPEEELRAIRKRDPRWSVIVDGVTIEGPVIVYRNQEPVLVQEDL
jgi:hypothetical protein